MNFSFRNSIGVKLLRVVFGCYLVITVIVTAVQLYFEYGNVEKDIVVELYNVGRSFEDGLSTALWSLDQNSMNSILAGVMKIEAVAGVKVVNIQGGIEASNGVFVDDEAKRALEQVIQAKGIVAEEIFIRGGAEPDSFYEYVFPLSVAGFSGESPETIGHVHLYAAENTVMSRFQNSLLLIVVNALIKTVALWLIFLYFSRKLLSSPLSDLSQASVSLSAGDMRSESELQRIEVIAEAEDRNELQRLAGSFLTMRSTILEKIDNLNTLNQFALILTSSKNQQRVYDSIYYLFAGMFGIKFGVVINEQGEQLYRLDMAAPDIPNLDTLGQNLITKGKEKSDSISELSFIPKVTVGVDGKEPLDFTCDILFLPLNLEESHRQELWLFGDIDPVRLEGDAHLSHESFSFLQVMLNMMCATLISLKQRENIEELNHSLEARVGERTQELARLNKDLMHMAVHDPLTQLPNRTLFNDRLAHQIAVAAREQRQFAVASIDLTDFKNINDSYGHDAGDVVLVEIGTRMSKVLRKSDTLARMGGDEYAAILTGDNIGDSLDVVVKNIVGAMEPPIVLDDGTNILASLNIGIALYPDHGTDADLLFKYADTAMYSAKRSGKGYALFDKDKNSKEKEYLQFMYELEHAIERDQLCLFYQPILDLKTRRPVAFEALLRWEHPERGMVPPDKFIPHAERTSLIHPITLWVVETACQQCVAWHKRGHQLSVSVNLSPRIFTSPALPSQLATILDKYGLEPRWLKLEITESTAMARPEQALEIISSLSNMGFPISIDDFGTGHSSLSYLTRLPVDELKIDRSFLLDKVSSSQAVVQTVIELAHTLNLHVVAEGIEDNETLEMLVTRGCDAVQGYYICRPNRVVEIDRWLASLDQDDQSASA